MATKSDKSEPNLQKAQAELGKTLLGVGISDHVAVFIQHSHFLSRASGAGHAISNALKGITSVLPIVSVILIGGLTVIDFFKAIGTKPEDDMLKATSRTVRFFMGLAILLLSIVSLAIPALFPILVFIAAGIGLAREIFNLVKTSYRYFQDKPKLRNLMTELKTVMDENNHEDITRLTKNIAELTLKQMKRRMKLVHRVLDVGLAVAGITAIAIAIAVGPVGWAVLAAVAVVGVITKFSLLAIQKRKMKKLQEKLNKPCAAVASEDEDKAPELREVKDVEHHEDTAEIYIAMARGQALKEHADLSKDQIRERAMGIAEETIHEMHEEEGKEGEGEGEIEKGKEEEGEGEGGKKEEEVIPPDETGKDTDFTP